MTEYLNLYLLHNETSPFSVAGSDIAVVSAALGDGSATSAVVTIQRSIDGIAWDTSGTTISGAAIDADGTVSAKIEVDASQFIRAKVTTASAAAGSAWISFSSSRKGG